MTRAIDQDQSGAKNNNAATATLVSDLHEELSGEFTELENWLSDQLETLEKRYASYITPHSLHSIIKQGR